MTSNHARYCQGVQAIFAVTNFWEHMFTGSSSSESRDKEVEQGMHVRAYYSHSFLNRRAVWATDYISSNIQSIFHSPALGLGSYPPSDPLRTRNADILHLVRHQNRHRRLQNRFFETLRLVQPARRRKDLWRQILRAALRLQSHYRRVHLRQTARAGPEDHVPMGGLLRQQPSFLPNVPSRISGT